MIGKIYITSSGYDPEHGKHVKDPYLGDVPSLGACRPDVRRVVKPGDHVFAISGKVPGHSQFILGGFEVAEKISAMDAYRHYPEQRLSRRDDGEIAGNVIVDVRGRKHRLDHHKAGKAFQRRISDYLVGCNPVALVTPAEIARGRRETLDVLARVLGKLGSSPFDLLGRSAKTLTEPQVRLLLEWLFSVKEEARGESAESTPETQEPREDRARSPKKIAS